MPQLSKQQKLQKLKRLVNAQDPIGIIEELESIEKMAVKESDLAELRRVFQSHIESIDASLKSLEQKKIDRAELNQTLEKLRQGLMSELNKMMSIVQGISRTYTLTEADKFDIAAKVRVPEKIIERTETIKETPIVKEVAVGDTPEQIREKLGLPFSVSDIDGLEERLKEAQKAKLPLGGFNKKSMDFHLIDDETPSGTINGSNTDFTLANIPNPASSLKVFRGGARQRIDEDYTLSGATISFTFAPVSGEIILCDYRV